MKFVGRKQSGTKQATRHEDVRACRRISWQGLLRWTLLILLLSLSLWGWQILRDPDNFPISTVQIRGKYPHLDPHRLRAMLIPYTDRSLFNVDIDGIRETLLEIPWVKQISVSRRWPHTLIITITEQSPVAIWGLSALMTKDGSLFYPKQGVQQSDFPTLPVLSGPQREEKNGLLLYQKLAPALIPVNLTITELKISERGSITLNLSNGIELILGKQYIIPRIVRFVHVFNKVFSIGGEIDDVVDMRYTNGMAVSAVVLPSSGEKNKNGKETE